MYLQIPMLSHCLGECGCVWPYYEGDPEEPASPTRDSGRKGWVRQEGQGQGAAGPGQGEAQAQGPPRCPATQSRGVGRV